MSSVGSSDSSNSSNSNQAPRNADDTIRKNREAYNQKQAELVKKQAKEVRRLNEEHYAEVENLKNAHSSQMEDLRENTHQEITERDHKYNADVEGLRDLYKKQMQTQADDSQKRESTLRKTTGGDLEQEKVQHEARVKKLTSDFDGGLKEREQTYEMSLAENREKQATALKETHDKLENNFEDQAKALKGERNERVGALQKGFDDYRQSTQAAQRTEQTRDLQKQHRSSEDLLRAVRKERVNAEDSQDYLREGFKDGIQKTQERFEKQAAKERAALEMSRDNLESSVGDRIDNQVTRLKRENQDLKDVNVRSELQNKQRMEHQVADVTDAYQRNMDNYQQQRDQAVHDANDRVHRDVQKIRQDLDSQAVDTSRYYLGQMNEQNQIQRSAYNNLKTTDDVRAGQQKDVADRRVKNLYDVTAEEKTRMAQIQSEDHKAAQRVRSDQVKKVHSELEADKQIAVSGLQERLERQEVQHGERMAQVVAKYEKQIQTLKDQMMRDKKESDESLKRTTEEMQRQHKTEMDQVAVQNRDRLRQLDGHHTDELRQLNKRNDERLDQMIGEIKKT